MDTAENEKASSGRRSAISFTIEPVNLKIVTEPYVVLTARGYAPVVDIEVDGETDRKVMFISAASLSQVLEEFRSENEGNFTGIHIKVRKESPDRFAKYVVEAAK